MTIKDIYCLDFVNFETFVVVRSDLYGKIFEGLVDSNSFREVFDKKVYRFSINPESNVLNIWVHI